MAAGLAAAAILLVVVVVVTGVPYLRPSLRSARALADKINRCADSAATVDWVTGMVETIGEPVNGPDTLTADERALIRLNGKVGLCNGSIR